MSWKTLCARAKLRLTTAIVAVVFSAAPVIAQSTGDDPPPPPPPAPSETSVVGDTVTNPLTGGETTVADLILDPASTPTAGTTAFVQTADGYVFLVKDVGETFYNSDNPPLAYAITAIDGTTATVSNSEFASGTADIETGLTQVEYDASFNSEDEPGDLTPPTNVSGPNGVEQVVYGQNGSNGRDGALFVPPRSGGDGADGPTQTQTLSTDVNATSNIGWEIGSVGGDGGNGGDSYASFFSGRSGGDGGEGGEVDATQGNASDIVTSGADNHGIFAFSRSGEAGNGGSGYAAPGGGTGGRSADGGTVNVTQNGTISTGGSGAYGIYGLSVSNNGGNGGGQWGLVGESGDGGYGGSGGSVTITSNGEILTDGNYAHGVLAQSIGGSGGSAGTSGNLLVSLVGSNDNGGNGGTVTVSNSGQIQTNGDYARGIFAQSIGGGGGTGGSAWGAIALGGAGSNGGSGDNVTVTNQSSGSIVTTGYASDGIMAQSIGGSGGDGGNAGGLISVGGNGDQAGSGAPVTVRNYGEIRTAQDYSRGIVAQSIGGGGGDGGNTGGWVSVGGSGAGGGAGSTVTVLNDGLITTSGADAMGILAQSVGGGGGNGGSSGSVGLFASVAVGGSGGAGGAGGNVNVTLSDTDSTVASSIQTSGDRSTGVFAQSIGGGGGRGGGAVSVGVGVFGAASIAVGGAGGSGGAGGTVIMSGSGDASVQTGGADAAGVLLQSVGGGGGNGGYAVSVAASTGPISGSLAVGVGGTAGSGGIGGTVQVGTVNSAGTLTGSGFSGSVLTTGDRSGGLIFQSIGGGGGNGGLSVAASGAAGAAFSGNLSISVGGDGGGGGRGGVVRAFTDADVTTQGDASTGILAQSIGGGGGNGGGSIAAGVSASGGGSASINVGVGGAADAGGNGNEVDLIARGDRVQTFGAYSQGVVAQSIGGGGGNGGYAIGAGLAAGGGLAAAVNVGVGGSGGDGGSGGVVDAEVGADVTTFGTDADGVVVQSIGGGGGNGGFSIAAGISGGGGGAGTVGVSLGGTGGSGGAGNTVRTTVNGAIDTTGDRSSGVMAQSIGGGGGDGGFSVSGSLSGGGVGSGSVDVGLGGGAGSGGNGGQVVATVNDTVTTRGADATGVLAQSIGGGGGNGGFNISASLTGSGVGSGAVSVGLGGDGGTGATGSSVQLTVNDDVTTLGDRSSGIVAQSIGGGGGNGGFNVSGSVSAAGTGAGSVAVGLGGSGAGGGNAGTVTATSNGQIFTQGFGSTGFVAQSIGGGGGNGGFNVSGAMSIAGTGSGAIGVGLGGSGAGGGNGNTVTARTTGNVETQGGSAVGILAQSVGGGGGNGAFDIAPTLSGSGTLSGSVSVGIGGSGGTGGIGGTVDLTVENNVVTAGDFSGAVVAQSIGGGGGNGGMNVSAGLAAAGTGAGTVGVGIGGRGEGGGDGGTVTSDVTGDIDTGGHYATGVLTQSVGGGGGSGGMNISVAMAFAGTGSVGASVGLGGQAGIGGAGGTVDATFDGTVDTTGLGSTGIVAQSLGGGGGNGGMNISATVTASKTASGGASVGIGGSGGSGGASGAVTSDVNGRVTTTADQAAGVVVQSVGGGGGNGGVNVSAGVNLSGTSGGTVAVGVGGAGGDGGNASTVTSTVTADVSTEGEDAAAVLAQSVGGGGGNGGVNISGALAISKTGSGAAAIGIGGFGGDGGTASTVTSDVSGTISTSGGNSAGVIAQSVGGGGGNGGTNVSGTISLASDFAGALGFGLGGFGGDGGTGGVVENTFNGDVTTRGDNATGVLTQSVGGGGGNGGTNITASLSLSRQTSGNIGFGIGGFGGGGANAGTTTTSSVTGNILTFGDNSSAIITQSLGGGGGNGALNVTAGMSVSMERGGALSLGLGGFGGDGGDGQTVSSTVRTTGDDRIETQGEDSTAIIAQSVGGGGGTGGTNVSGTVSLSGKDGAGISLGVGGFGGSGGNGGAVALDVEADVMTSGDGSHGILAQSVGGSGGAGGTNISGSMAFTKPSGSDTVLSIAMGVGGFGGGGGDADDVDVDYTGTVQAVPLEMQSDGSYAVAENDGADGIVAQSIGGGGGDGGINVSAGLTIASRPGAGQTDQNASYGVLVGVGGFGGLGGDAGNVDLTIGTGSQITAHGSGQSGVIAQSVGGGGGRGGLNVSGGIVSDSSLIVGVGGFGGNAGAGGDVVANVAADITVTTHPDDINTPSDDSFEDRLRDLVGDEVVDVSEDLAQEYGLRDLMVDMGLFEGEDGPDTDGSAGLLAQSIGGGGGSGGLNVSGGIALNKDGKIPSVTFGVGGFGGAGNVSGNVDATNSGTISVAGSWKHGIFAQSVAGGGGSGALNISGQLDYAGSETSDGGTDLSIVGGLGGHGGDGADAGNVTVSSTGDIYTTGYQARGLFAQSVGGGGGTGGINVSAVGTQNSSPIAVGVGGFGAGGGHAGDVTVERGSAGASAGLIQTNGNGAVGIEASSIGGGGGNAGVNAVVGFSRTTGSKSDSGSSSDRKTPTHTGVDNSVIANYNAVLDELEGKTATQDPDTGQNRTFSAALAIGGAAGTAGHGGTVQVDQYGNIITLDDDSHGILGQSIGGGGGNAALNMGAIYQAGNTENNKGFGLAVGGGTGDGGNGGTVTVNSTGDISTVGEDSIGVFAQSVGGGGGNAGYDFVSNGSDGGSFDAKIGRIGGTGGSGGAVTLSSDGTVLTTGDRSYGLLAQSIGNGGGNSSVISASVSGQKTEDAKAKTAKLSIGLEGGEGGTADEVSITASGSVTTSGEDAHAIFAQSVGGGGGNGGSVFGGASEGGSTSVSIGGNGGEGGTGGAVDVTSSATIDTTGSRSVGIFAQSVGGAGGTGGSAKGGQTAFSALKANVKGKNVGATNTLSIGGSGGVGMASDTVTVDNSGSILTRGVASHGIQAQSVGGGGGKGGSVLYLVTNLRGTIGDQNTVNIGGSGGEGAVSANVDVTNSNRIETQGDRANGIFAQSVGGGGGDAQYIRNIQLGADADSSTKNTLNIGGAGGEGAASADARVTNSVGGVIVTSGEASHGIFAQSVGGGGGTGGDVETVTFKTGTSAATSTREINLSLGSVGGEGGTSGLAFVENTGSIVTTGRAAHGIFAQSVGGGGGAGGHSLTGRFSLKQGDDSSSSLSLNIGGAGGSGNVAGDAEVINSGEISVSGDGAHGIFAQSVGGGGGNGGMALTVDGTRLTDTVSGKAYNAFAIGGSGGDGANAGDVDVTHTGTIVVGGDDAYGILAQSVGGAGGNASFGLSASAVSLFDYGFSSLLGARDGTDGRAGEVTVNSTGDIIITGENSEAILAQSINGGGGNVDILTQMSEDASTLVSTFEGILGLGGNDVDGSSGSNVEQSHDGDVVTTADMANGTVVQSIGGGGGTTKVETLANPTADVSYEARLGAINTDDAMGGDVASTREGDTLSLGMMSGGSQIQSIGGGGGRLVIDSTTGGDTNTAQVILGADPSFRNDGGDINLDLTGNTVTIGDYAHAQIIQSIGAGGGEALLSGLSGATVTIGAQDDSTGDGGNVTVIHDGDVETQGTRSHGFVLQSIGGGGGIVTTDLDAAEVTVDASTANEGGGGTIDFENTGHVLVNGSGSVGILAQSLGGGGGLVDGAFRGSAGGVGSSGAVTVDQTGDVFALTEDGVALFAQSEGADGAGNIDIDYEGILLGGSGAGAALELSGGDINTVNIGASSFVMAMNERAFVGGSGTDNITLEGRAYGNVDLGGSDDTFTVAAGGTFHGLGEVNLGPSGLFQVNGTLTLGGDLGLTDPLAIGMEGSAFAVAENAMQTLDLNGSIGFGGTASYTADVYFYQQTPTPQREGDLINATGDGLMGGMLIPVLYTLEQAQPYVLVDVGGTSGDAGTIIEDTIVLDYEIGLNGATGDGSSIDLTITPAFAVPSTNSNQAAVGNYIDRVLLGDGSAPMGDVFALIGLMTTEEEIVAALDQFTVQDYAASLIESMNGILSFSDQLRGCDPARDGNEDGSCFWVSAGPSSYTREATDTYRAMSADTNRFAVGRAIWTDNDNVLSFAFGHDNVGVRNGDQFSAEGERVMIGASYSFDAPGLERYVSLSVGHGSYESQRFVDISGTLPGGGVVTGGTLFVDQPVTTANLGFGAARSFDFGSAGGYLKPSFDVGLTLVQTGDSTVSGTPIGAIPVATTNTIVTAAPSLEIGVEREASAATMFNGYLRGTAILSSDDSLAINATLPGVSGADGTFSNVSGFDKSRGEIAAGVAFQRKDNTMSFSVEYKQEVGSLSDSESVGFSFGLKF